MAITPTSIGPGTRVSLTYSVYDEEGDLVDASEEGSPLTYLHGYGQLVPGLERQLEGMWAGQKRSVQVPADEAYGEHDPDDVFQVARDELPDPDQVRLEDEFEFDDDNGDSYLLRVVEILDDGFIVDANHPLAGIALRFEIEVVSVDIATDDEIEQAEQALLDGEDTGSGLLTLGRKPPGEAKPS
jgi:FKBP-type peptidyl-prolyl cis-trans isomerase SlyD